MAIQIIGNGGVIADVDAGRNVNVSLIQNIALSATNSSTTNIAAAASFTGAWVSNLGVACIQTNFFADQNCTVQIQQSVDGTNIDHNFTFRTQASIGNVRTVFAAGSFVRIVVTNNGGSTTTSFRLQTVLAPISLASEALNSVSVDTVKNPTYRASTIIPLVAAVTADVPFFNIIGSATKTVTIKRFRFSGMSLTAVGYFTIAVQKLSTASTGGTSTTLAAVPLDSRLPAATAVVKAYTAIPTRGTLIGTTASWRALWQATVAVAGGPTADHVFGSGDIPGAHGPILRGVAEEICLVFPVALGSAGTLAIDIEWVEE